MFCENCGKPVAAGAAACGNCGAAVEQAAPAAPPEPALPPPPVPKPIVGGAATLQFGPIVVRDGDVIGPEGRIPLDQVSACIARSTPKNMTFIIIGAVIALAGLGMLFKDGGMVSLLVIAAGAGLLYLGLRTLSFFRVYSTSGEPLTVLASAVDLSGSMQTEFEQFSANLLELRRQHLRQYFGR
jgi:hypothetical protein